MSGALGGEGSWDTTVTVEEDPVHRSRTALAAVLLALPIALAGCSGDEGDVDVNAPDVEVSPGDVDVDAPDVDAPDVDAPDVDAPDAPDVDVDADVEESEDADGEAGPDESPNG